MKCLLFFFSFVFFYYYIGHFDQVNKWHDNFWSWFMVWNLLSENCRFNKDLNVIFFMRTKNDTKGLIILGFEFCNKRNISIHLHLKSKGFCLPSICMTFSGRFFFWKIYDKCSFIWIFITNSFIQRLWAWQYLWYVFAHWNDKLHFTFKPVNDRSTKIRHKELKKKPTTISHVESTTTLLNKSIELVLPYYVFVFVCCAKEVVLFIYSFFLFLLNVHI